MFIYSVVGFTCWFWVCFYLKLKIWGFVKEKKLRVKKKIINLFDTSQIIYVPTHPYNMSNVRQREHRHEHFLKVCMQ